MPDNVIRCGQFASSTSSFLTEPSPADEQILPVNCEMKDWSTDTWKAHAEIHDSETETGEYITGPSLSDSAADDDVAIVRYRFRYQATVDSSFELTYAAESNGLSATISAAVSNIIVNVNGFIVFFDTDTGINASVSGSEAITLPASTLPAIVSIDCQGANGLGSTGDATVTLSITP